jgi:hypothetical protein
MDSIRESRVISVNPQIFAAFGGIGGSIGDAKRVEESPATMIKKRVRILEVNIRYKIDNSIGGCGYNRSNEGVLYNPTSLFHFFFFSSGYHHLDAPPRDSYHSEYRSDSDRVFDKFPNPICNISISEAWDECFIWILDNNLSKYRKRKKKSQKSIQTSEEKTSYHIRVVIRRMIE